MLEGSFREVRVSPRANHGDHAAVHLELRWRCPACGGPRGDVRPTFSCDGSRRWACDGWVNPCGHVDYYTSLRSEADMLALSEWGSDEVLFAYAERIGTRIFNFVSDVISGVEEPTSSELSWMHVDGDIDVRINSALRWLLAVRGQLARIEDLPLTGTPANRKRVPGLLVNVLGMRAAAIDEVSVKWSTRRGSSDEGYRLYELKVTPPGIGEGDDGEIFAVLRQDGLSVDDARTAARAAVRSLSVATA
jgi:hypothetical protein